MGANSTPQKNKRTPPGPHKRNTSGLKKGGRKPREIITQPELDLLNYILDGATKADAARWAGFPGSNPSQHAQNALRKPIVQATLVELQELRKKESIERTGQLRDERRLFAHHHSLHLARKMKTHKFRGDADIVKHAENLLKSVGEIQPNSVSASANASAKSASATVAVDIYKPAWLREHEAKLLSEAERRYGPMIPSPEAKQLSPEKALIYVQRAMGDKDRAREMARTDGWEF